MHKRRARLLDLLRERGQMDVAELVAALNVSEATVRRDLAALEEEGLLTRTFGGARLHEEASLVVRTFEQKREHMGGQKERIARRAAALVHPGMTVALDSGTTVWCIATALKQRGPLTIVTSALAAVEELGSVENIEVHLTGGRFRLDNLDFIGPRAIEALQGFHTDIAFLSADGFTPGDGLFSSEEWSAAISKALAACADRVVLAIDHSKFGTRGPFRSLATDGLDVLITDSGLNGPARAAAANDPYKLIIAD